MSPEDIARLEAEAKELGVPKTELIRRRVFGEEFTRDEIERQLQEINRRLDAIEKKL